MCCVRKSDCFSLKEKKQQCLRQWQTFVIDMIGHRVHRDQMSVVVDVQYSFNSIFFISIDVKTQENNNYREEREREKYCFKRNKTVDLINSNIQIDMLRRGMIDVDDALILCVEMIVEWICKEKEGHLRK